MLVKIKQLLQGTSFNYQDQSGIKFYRIDIGTHLTVRVRNIQISDIPFSFSFLSLPLLFLLGVCQLNIVSYPDRAKYPRLKLILSVPSVQNFQVIWRIYHLIVTPAVPRGALVVSRRLRSEERPIRSLEWPIRSLEPGCKQTSTIPNIPAISAEIILTVVEDDKKVQDIAAASSGI